MPSRTPDRFETTHQPTQREPGGHQLHSDTSAVNLSGRQKGRNVDAGRRSSAPASQKKCSSTFLGLSLPSGNKIIDKLGLRPEDAEKRARRNPTVSLEPKCRPPDPSPEEIMQRELEVQGDNVPLVPKWNYKRLYHRMRRRLQEDKVDIRVRLYLDDLWEIYFADLDDRYDREWNRKRLALIQSGEVRSPFKKGDQAFATSLDFVALCASTSAVIDGYRHQIPLAVYLSIEELCRRGTPEEGLMRHPRNSQRYNQLVEIFNTPPLFGYGFDLSGESLRDVAALLSTWLRNTPPVVHPAIMDPLWHWCVRPSVDCHDERRFRDEGDWEGRRTHFYKTGERLRGLSPHMRAERARQEADEDMMRDARRIPIARDLFRLLPSHSLSIMCYVLSFLVQLPSCCDVTFDEIAKRFGHTLLGGTKYGSQCTMLWLLQHWPAISEGIFDPESMHPETEDHVRPRLLKQEAKPKGPRPKPRSSVDLNRTLPKENDDQRKASWEAYYGADTGGGRKSSKASNFDDGEDSDQLDTYYQERRGSDETLC
ncbi:hypothetical protein FA95DRAFT_1554626 [Auriscalpium vulgare]|uniref:Uncharacterized protein n=1 Tax=Auriscalpium vulgare TaxID=40419 RepID=A0ACB8S467_9AGAM|nr:hypothetical protein FA95DRAFT_1554626 [Auriscalpium vulgare]